jgi:hypothetical protein
MEDFFVVTCFPSSFVVLFYAGSDFGSPETVTSGGTQYGDETPQMVLESDGDIHLVFFRDHSASDGEAL